MSKGDIRVSYHERDGTCSIWCFPDMELFAYFCFGFFAESAQSGREHSFEPLPRHQPHAAQLHRGQHSSAIQRRTVLSETPAKRAISPARRYSGASVISDPPAGLLAVRWRRPLGGKFTGSLARQQAHERNQRIGPRRSAALQWMLNLARRMPTRNCGSARRSEWPNRSQFCREAPFKIVRTRLRQASSENSIS